MIRNLLLGLVVLAFSSSASFIYAEDVFEASPWTKASSYGDKVQQKYVFGMQNILLGWTEILTEKAEARKDGASINQMLHAGLRGVCNALADTAGGLLHVLTFPIPVDFPLPEGGTDIVRS